MPQANLVDKSTEMGDATKESFWTAGVSLIDHESLFLIEFLQIDPKTFEQRVLSGETDEELLAWVKANSRKPSDQEIAQWSQDLLSSGPKDDAARQRFQGRLQDIATKRGVLVSSLPPVHTWVDVIEVDEERL